MTIDHIGLIFFPQFDIFRIIGRIALPIFAFMIAEGCRYTRNKVRYFLSVFLLAFICQSAYFLYNGDTYMSILVTFSISILNIYAFHFFKMNLFNRTSSKMLKILSGLLFIFAVVSTYQLNQILMIDYGFYGCMLPLFASIFNPTISTENDNISSKTRLFLSVFMLGIGLLLLGLDSDTYQFWSFLALPILLLYSGKRGKLKIKYFFYIFYPTHLLLLEGLNILI